MQTALMQSSFKEKIFRFEQNGGNCYLINWRKRDGNSPYTYKIGDLKEIMEANDYFCFARKFDEKIDFNIVQELYSCLNGR